MADIIGVEEPHVTELLGLYYLDALGRNEGGLVEDHLLICAPCRAMADQIIETIASLALLTDRDRDEVLDNFGALDRTGPPPERFVRFIADEPAPSMVKSPPSKPGDAVLAAPATST